MGKVGLKRDVHQERFYVVILDHILKILDTFSVKFGRCRVIRCMIKTGIFIFFINS
jgi:hypothetical protein